MVLWISVYFPLMRLCLKVLPLGYAPFRYSAVISLCDSKHGTGTPVLAPLVMGKIAMKKFLLAAVGLFAIGVAPAMAADLPVKAYTKAPLAPEYDWSGFYIGVNAGGGWSHKCWDVSNILGVTLPLLFADGCQNPSGGLAGGQIGYRWESASWVFGLEAAGDWANLKGSSASPLNAGTIVNVTNQSKVNGLGFFTAQVGHAWNNVLWYMKGGAAVAGDKYNGFLTVNGVGLDNASETRVGGVIGTGLEYGLTANIIIGVDYQHAFMGARSITFLPNVPLPVISRIENIRQDVDVVTARLSYKFGGPVVAKY
jgi:outer membrane immunogenic protein